MNDQETKTEEGKPSEGEVPEEETKPLSKIEQANAAAERLEKANTERERLLLKQEDIIAEQKLSGTTGLMVENKVVSEEDKKVNNAQEFFKDTALGDAIKKANE